MSVGSIGGCQFVDVVKESDATFDAAACRRFVTDAVAALRASPARLVIVAGSITQLLGQEGGTRLTDPRTGEVSTTPARRAAIYEDGLVSVMEQLASVGTPTMVVHTVPHLGDDGADWIGATCPAVKILLHACGFGIDRAAVEAQQRLARESERRAVARVPSASAVDFTDQLCSTVRCEAQRDGVWLYRDATHLSVDGALSLTDGFRQAVLAHLREQ